MLIITWPGSQRRKSFNASPPRRRLGVDGFFYCNNCIVLTDFNPQLPSTPERTKRHWKLHITKHYHPSNKPTMSPPSSYYYFSTIRHIQFLLILIFVDKSRHLSGRRYNFLVQVALDPRWRCPPCDCKSERKGGKLAKSEPCAWLIFHHNPGLRWQ